MKVLSELFQKGCNFLYPRHCVHCEEALREETLFCADCASQIKRLTGPTCFVCSTPFISEAATSHSPDHRCSECREHSPPFSKAVTPFLYEGPLVKAICQFKYGKKPHLATPLARLIANDLAHFSAGGVTHVQAVMAVPLHPSRLRTREFNQSLLLAKKIAGAFSLPYSIDALIRTRETPPQVGLSKKEREENIKGAFQVMREKEVCDRRILLVDDVYTTGATLKEGAKTLMRSGAKEVIVATVARMGLA